MSAQIEPKVARGTHTKVETELIPFSCAYGECDHTREDECPEHKDFICQECTDALDDDTACVLWDDYDHQIALLSHPHEPEER